MKSKLLIALLLFTLVLISNSCCKDESCTDDTNPQCSNYNPCKNLPTRPASFKMYEELGMYLPDSLAYLSQNYIQDGDTGLIGEGYIIFQADYPNADSYEWQIGNEGSRRTGKSVDVSFGGNTERSIKITLYVKYSKDKDCFKNYSGFDTVSKTIHFTEYRKHCMWGTYIGTWSHNPSKLDTFKCMTIYNSIEYDVFEATGLFGFTDSARILIAPARHIMPSLACFNGLYVKYKGEVWDYFMGLDYRDIKYKLTINPKTKDVQMVVLSWDRRLSTKDFGDLKTYYFKGKKQ